MSTAAVSSSSIYQQLESYFRQHSNDVQQQGKDLQAGDLSAVQQDYTTIQTLGQSGPSVNGVPFQNASGEQDFTAIGQGLQSGNISTAQQAYKLQSTFHHDRCILAPQSGVGNSGAGASGGSATGIQASPVGTPAFNLNQNSNQQIVLSLLHNTTSTPTPGNVNLSA